MTIQFLEDITINPSYTPIPESILPSSFGGVVDLSGIYTDIYFSSTGNNSTGDGSLANPFASLDRAVEEIYDICGGVWRNGGFILHGSGITTVPSGWSMPPLYCTDKIITDAVVTDQFGYRYVGPLRIQADMQLQLTIPLANVTGQVVSSDNNLLTISTNLVLLPSAFNDFVIVDANNTKQRISTNSAGSISCNSSFALTPPLRIYSNNAEINPAAFGFFSTITIENGSIVPILQGFRLGDNGGFQALSINNNQMVVLESCDIEGVAANIIYNAGNPVRILDEACVFRNAIWCSGLSHNSFASNFNKTDVSFIDYDTSLKYSNFFATDCDTFGVGAFTGECPTLNFTNFIMQLGLSDAIKIGGANATLVNGTISSNAGDAIEVYGNSFVQCSEIHGTLNTGFGINAHDNALVVVDSSTNVSGALGEAKVDNLPVQTWVDTFGGAGPFGIRSAIGSAIIANLGSAIQERNAAINVSANTTLNQSNKVVFVDTTAGVITITLPPIANNREVSFKIIRHVGAVNSVTIAAAPGNTILGIATFTLATLNDTVVLNAPIVGTDWAAI